MSYSIDSVKKTMGVIADALIGLEAELTAIDSKLGDGDMGLSMANGGRAIKTCLEGYGEASIDKCLETCAQAFNRAAPSTMGTLLSMSARSVAALAKGKEALDDSDVAKIPGLMAQTIQKFGKAHVGDKTILDALVPFAEAFESEWTQNQSISEALKKADEAAQAGMQTTIGMEARTGRARWLRGRNADCPDGGCVMLVGVSHALLDSIK